MDVLEVHVKMVEPAPTPPLAPDLCAAVPRVGEEIPARRMKKMGVLEAHVKMKGSAPTHLPVLVSPALVQRVGMETLARTTPITDALMIPAKMGYA